MTRTSKLIPAAQKVLSEYQNRITIRQLYYRLVSAGLIRNSLVSYKVLVTSMIKARRDGSIDFSVFYDATRHATEGEAPDPEIQDYEELFNFNKEIVEDAESIAIRQLQRIPYAYNLPLWYEQPNYVEVWIEKESLSSVVSPIAEKYGVTFVACRGYPSLSLLYDSTSRFNAVPEDKATKILYFGDYDCRGVNIEENLQRNLEDDFGVDVEVIRYALTKEQIAEYQLPPQPAKQTDTMIKGWLETNGNVAWELDALPPDKLSVIVENAILSNIDDTARLERESTLKTNREWMTQQITEFLAHWSKKDGVEP